MSFLKRLDVPIFLLLVTLAMISCFFVYSTTKNFSQYSDSFLLKQLLFFLLGFFLLFLVAHLGLEQLKTVGWVFYFLVLLLLIGLMIAPESIAREINGAKSWYQIKYIGTFQPSEFLKFAFLIVIATTIESHKKKFEHSTVKSDIVLLLKVGIITMPPILLVYMQPDTGMIMLYLALLIPMIYLSGLNKKVLTFFLSIPLLLLGTTLFVYFQFQSFFYETLTNSLSDHQMSRIYGWLQPDEYPDSSFQTRVGIVAIGSGEISGKGYLQNNVYIPEKHTDFIFATIAEETGFIGGSIVIILFFSLIYHITMITLHANTLFTSMLGAGIIGLLGFQIFQNIGMTMGLLPVTGITLPFLSYGGSSLLSNMMLIGLVFIIKQSYHHYIFKESEMD